MGLQELLLEASTLRSAFMLYKIDGPEIGGPN